MISRRSADAEVVGDVIVSRRYIPVHGTIYDLFSYLDGVVLAIDFR